jgi:hypothetical protein
MYQAQDGAPIKSACHKYLKGVCIAIDRPYPVCRACKKSSLLLSSQQASAILMQTQGDAPETDPAISTVVDDSGSGATTIRGIAQFDVAKITGASAGLNISQTTQSDLYYIPLGFTLNRSATGLLELNLKLSYAAENDVVTPRTRYFATIFRSNFPPGNSTISSPMMPPTMF